MAKGDERARSSSKRENAGLHVDEKGASVGLQPYQTLAKQADFSVFWRFFGMFQGRICRGIGRLQSYRFAP